MAINLLKKNKFFKQAIIILKNFSNEREINEWIKQWRNTIADKELKELLLENQMIDSLIDFLCENSQF